MEENIKYFKNLNLSNTGYHNLRIEAEQQIIEPRKVRGYHYSLVKPTKRQNPVIMCLSKQSFSLLDLDSNLLQQKENDLAEYLSGNKIIENSFPMAHCYCGFQFGNWANQLGDGRAITLGDYTNLNNQIWELQLKGSGKTPYSRFADGAAVLRSSVREFLCSEAMNALGIPTTRAASIIATDDLVQRDPLYQNKVINEKCCVVLRLSPSFIRFGSFQVCQEGEAMDVGPSFGLEDIMIKGLLNYTIKYHYQDIYNKHQQKLDKDAYFEFFEEITKRTAHMVALWQTVGFVHGVLNTDNMSILGLTIDYGPFEFIDHFNKRHISNYSDKTGRYCYENQPEVCKWNLIKLAEGLHPFLDKEETIKYVNMNYFKFFDQSYHKRMREKLGLHVEIETDKELFKSLFNVMDQCNSEFTNTFRILSSIQIDPEFQQDLSENDLKVLENLVSYSPDKQFLEKRLKPQMSLQQITQLLSMFQTNKYQLLMMGLNEEFIEQNYLKAQKYEELMALSEEDLQKQFHKNWSEWLIKYKQRLVIEWNKENLELQNKQRKELMDKVNPRIVLRNYFAEEIIRKANEGDYSDLKEALEILENPYDETKQIKQCKITPNWAYSLCVSCSS